MEADREAFSAWAAGAQRGLLRTAFLLTGDHHRAEDLVQEALTKVALRWSSLSRQQPTGYARQILIRDNISWWRRLGRESVTAPSELRDASAEPDGIAVERRLALARALATLTPRQRAVIVLRYYDDLTVEATADAMGVTTGTVKSQTHLALRRLREGAPDLVELLEEIP